MNNNKRFIIIGIMIGIVISIGMYFVNDFLLKNDESQMSHMKEDNQPLYWVAPMDANFQRDKPGKSPMGMDLVPVYKKNTHAMNESVGTVYISPNMVSNLGVRTTSVSYEKLVTNINTVGYVTDNEESLIYIHPRVEGWIEKLYIKSEGDNVKKGQPLYSLYSPELVNAQEEFLLALKRKNNVLITAAKSRLTALQFSDKSILRLEKSQHVTQKVTFYAPQNGVVKSLNIGQGAYVKPNMALAVISDLSEVWIEAHIFERQAEQVKLGNSVTIMLDSLPGKYWQAKIDYIYPVLNEKTRTAKLRLRINNDNLLLKPNMFAQVIIHSKALEKNITIPQEALIRTGLHDRVVLALAKGQFKSVVVNVGRYGDNKVEILNGLNIGEKIVSSGQFLLDSESSKTSDFKRIDQPLMENITTGLGEVKAIDITEHNNRKIKFIVHSLETLSTRVNKQTNQQTFLLANNINLANIKKGMLVDFTFEYHNDISIITRMSVNLNIGLNEIKGQKK